MKTKLAALAVCFAMFPLPLIFAAEPLPAVVSTDSSSRAGLPDAPSAAIAEASGHSVRLGYGPNTKLRLNTAPFSALSVGMTFGASGFGFTAATPLASKIDLRMNASFLNYNPDITAQGLPIDGSIKFRSIGAGIDVYPYHGSFHITPGVTMYNGNHATATMTLAAGQTFTLEDTTYTSSASDPVRGICQMDFGHKFAPSLTVGLGNMLRRDSHWSVPVDFGFQYVGQPKFAMQVTGSVCDPTEGCYTIASDAGTVANLKEETADVNNAISPLRFFPIMTVGLTYRFGHNVEMAAWR